MSLYDTVGRVPKHAFIISHAVLLGLNIIIIAVRFCIKRLISERFAADDVCILVSLSTLIASLVILFAKLIDDMYFAQALLLREPWLVLPPNTLQRVFSFQRWNAIMLGLTWTSVMFVKFSFLCLFRRLVDRLRFCKIYWWCVSSFCFALLIAGGAQYYYTCPYFGDFRARSTVFEIFSDVLILAIPVKLIWKVRIKWTQKVGLGLSLCLLIFVIIATIIRGSGLEAKGMIDIIWQTYWLLVCAQIGLFMTSATAFRTFFVAVSHPKALRWPGRTRTTQDRSSSWVSRIGSRSTWRWKSERLTPNTTKDYELPAKLSRARLNSSINIARGHNSTVIYAAGQTQDQSWAEEQGLKLSQGYSCTNIPLFHHSQQCQSLEDIPELERTNWV
ncbi:hypothetical protein EJ05DRAFT_484655 [Pseudovirgaria hyperparasitica]|uniref:Rhodopsin domain-containing protein n=1 Tax=Pseudovirgaria hyperparasitica TaxID=470096 RepID=A0A6A6WCQ4_9PEZI|nr:uncharacterized protein EJ05DRAFT_484655 [Pseudovirgaria hyperparasitica]KAF2759740.1 hypothetical protein EJ05DRAFT_484655 [Pseudovirgaria hyperparasitica]